MLKSNKMLAVRKTGEALATGLGYLRPEVRPWIPAIKLVLELGPSAVRAFQSRRLRTFAALLVEEPDVDFSELRLRRKSAPGREAINREFQRMLDALESADSDEVLEPMVHLFALYSQPASTTAERSELLALARLLRELRAGDIEGLRTLSRESLQSSRDDPLLFWNGAELGDGGGSGLAVGVERRGVLLDGISNASRLFRLIKQADLGVEVGATRSGYDSSMDFLPSGEQTLQITRAKMDLLRTIMR